MKRYTRRQFLANSALAAAGMGLAAKSRYAADLFRRQPLDGVRIGVIDINDNYGGLAMTAQIGAVEKAARIGFEGVEVTFGGPDEDGVLLLAREERQQRYLEEFDRHGVRAAGTHLFVLHDHLLKNPDDPLGRRYVEQAIPATRALNTDVVLLPFFGDGALENRREMNYVADLVGELAAEADAHNVILGLENSLSAEDNMRILERADSSAVQVYYDVGNSVYFGHDIYSEIPWLGGDHICQFHIKDNPHYMGEGDIDFHRIFRSIDEIGFEGWVNIETLSPSGNREEDLRRNLDFTRQVIDDVRSETG